MTTTDPTITIAGLRAQVESLQVANRESIAMWTEAVEDFDELAAQADGLTAERDALAAQLAEVRAELAKAPKVCAIHSYALEGPCMTCGAPWPGAEKALRQERIEGMEKMLRISRAVGCPNSVEEVVEAVAAIKADLASERAHLAACRTRIAGLEQAANERAKEDKDRGARMDAIRAALGAHPFASDDHIADRIRALTARVAELEARPVLADEALSAALNVAGLPGGHAPWIMAKLGPVTLPPAQDRAEELIRSILGERNALMSGIGATLDDKLSDAWASEWINATRAALASLGAPPTSPTAARPVFAGVSVDELARVSADEYDGSGDQIGDADRAAIRAVLARLEVSLVAPVDPEAVALRLRDHAREIGLHPQREPADYLDSLAALVRVIFTAAGIPVAPEVRK